MGRPKRRNVSTSSSPDDNMVKKMSNDSIGVDQSLDDTRYDRDCYNEVLHINKNSDVGRIHSSWLVEVGGIDRGGTCMGRLCGETGDWAENEIRTLTSQLSQVKQRLGPAAESCAEAYNKCIAKDESTGPHYERGRHQTTPKLEFAEARRICNPFEELGEREHRVGLMNRAAIKLANIDALLDFRLTQCENRAEPFVFVDICGAPGGFSEYIMYRCFRNRTSFCQGTGMSLRGSNEHGAGLKWKLQHMSRFCPQSAQFRVCDGADGTGDVYQWENVEVLRQFIEEDSSCHYQGDLKHVVEEGERSDGRVHLVVADGGFDAQRDSDCQEELAQKIVVCQAAAAVTLLKQKGTFVLKMFGFRTDTTRCVMKSLFHAFQRITVLKPVSSRPASAERYVVFEGFEGMPGCDGLCWRNQMFLGDTTSRCDSADCEDCEARLVEYLDRMDRDILSLNLKACFEIMSYLERKSRALNQVEYFGNHGGNYRLSTADMQRYRQAWRLGKIR